MAKNPKGTNRSSKKDTGDEAVPAISNAAAKQLTEIRNLLFSETVEQLQQDITTQFSDQEKKLGELTVQIETSAKEISKEMEKQVSRVDNAIQKESEISTSTSDSLKSDIDTLREELQQHRSWAESEHENIYGELMEKHETAIKKIEAVAEELIDRKVERSTLAKMFNDIASSLNQESVKDDNSTRSKKRS